MQEFDLSDDNIVKSIDDDYFDRKKHLLNLIKMISNLDGCKNIALDASWGTGKTVFVNQLKYLINEENNETYNSLCTQYSSKKVDLSKVYAFYFNAWEHDIINEPVMNLVKELIDQNSFMDINSRSKYQNLCNILKNVSIKLCSGGILDKSDFENEASSIEQELSNIDMIKKLYKDIIEIIKVQKSVDKIVIIIDELDRCRPSYSISMLETLKHLIDVEGVIFLVSTDLEQLAHTVRTMYGNGFNAELYLQRFFYGILSLNTPSIDAYLKFEMEFFIEETHIFNISLKHAISFYNLKIREINNVIRRCSMFKKDLFSNGSKKEHMIAGIIIPWGICLKYHNNTLFNKFKSGNIEEEIFSNYIKDNDVFLEWILDYKIFGNVGTDEYIKKIYYIYQLIFKSKLVDTYTFNYEDEQNLLMNINKDKIIEYLEY